MKNQRSVNDFKTDLRLNCIEVLKQYMYSIESKDAERLYEFIDQDNPSLRLDCARLATRSIDHVSSSERIVEEAEISYKFITAKS